MNCEKYLPLIDHLIEGEIGGQNARQINLHISSCDQCSVYYNTLKREKEMYAHYLFDVEPPADLWAQFQAKINAEESGTISQIPEKMPAVLASFWKPNIFQRFRLYPTIGFAVVVLIVLGFGLFKAVFDKTVFVEHYTAQKDSNETQAINNHSAEIVKNEETDSSTKIVPNKIITRQKNLVKTSDKAVSLNRKLSNEKTNKIVVAKLAKKVERITTEADREKVLINAQPDEQQLQQSQLKNLESETARQAEKTELLLRSFRNARVVDGGSVYDVEYEKQQARKLLEQNVRLRQIAEVYGNLYVREILERVEPLLLDIANLENNPAEEKVLDIKERVKNQNIIASLQVY